MNIRFAWASAFAQFKAGKLWVLILALSMAIGALGSINLLTDRMRLLLDQEASAFLAADILLRSDKPIDSMYSSTAKQMRLEVFESIEVPTMAFNSKQEKARLVGLKGISGPYPLRGTLLIRDCETCEPKKHVGPPESGTVFIDKPLAVQLSVGIGDEISLGELDFKVAGLIEQEQDRQGGFSSFNPRVMMNMDDVWVSGLVQEASRARFKMGVAGKKIAVQSFEQWSSGIKEPKVRVESEEEERSEIDQTLARANSFLSLVALLSALLCCGALALGARQYAKQSSGQIALSKALGNTQAEAQLQGVFALVITALVSCILGIIMAYAGQHIIVTLLGDLLPEGLPQPSLMPMIETVVMCVLLLWGFAFVPIRTLSRVSAQAALRKDESLWLGKSAPGLLLGLVVFLLLLVWKSQNVYLGGIAAGGFAASLLVMLVLSFIGLKIIGSWAVRLPFGTTRLALLGLSRRTISNSALAAGVATGIFALSVLTLVRTDLSDSWRNSIPQNAPNRFLIEVLPDQKEPLLEVFKSKEVQGLNVYPIARLRLTHINNQPIKEDQFENTRVERTVRREWNISVKQQLPAGNIVTSGVYTQKGTPTVSLEQEVAMGLGVKVGDMLTYTGALGSVTVPVGSIRKLDWTQMSANFFALIDAPALEPLVSQNLVTFKALGDEKKMYALEEKINQIAPNVIIINTEQIEKQVRSIIDKALLAIQSLFLFALFCGLLVLWSALLGTRDERIREASIARALGASSRQLMRMQSIELIGLGLCAGVIGSALAMASSVLIGSHVLGIAMSVNPIWLLVFGGVGALLCWLSGILALRGVVGSAALDALRSSE